MNQYDEDAMTMKDIPEHLRPIWKILSAKWARRQAFADLRKEFEWVRRAYFAGCSQVKMLEDPECPFITTGDEMMDAISSIRKLVKEIRSETNAKERWDNADRIFLMLDKVERELPYDDERAYLAGAPPEYEE